ncbi:DOMON domain-containing protein [Ulvibacterium sp.]|uniref:DOMON domain-containing protein n=1 Tax=Ulvibacterium sp. TaxID=2665914 RepID=UPI00261E3A47|nr:DOMON domain-containing protein [Ulvibacterium sp.]
MSLRSLKKYVFYTCLCAFTGLYGQQTITVSGISFTYALTPTDLECTVTAPTQGWVGVGFNEKNTIVGSDLLLFHVVDGKTTSTDMYVKGLGNPIKDSHLGGQNSIQVLHGKEEGHSTTIRFSIPLNSGDPNDFIHEIGKEFWLILAYSVEDDFEHHSRVRKHIPFRLLDAN